jgi:hypothetical protein
MKQLLKDGLIWDTEAGYGFHPEPVMEYSGSYFEKYVQMDQTPMGFQLTKARCNLVERHYQGTDIIDVGIGGGAFCIESGAYGYDVSQEAVQWLKERGTYLNPYESKCTALTCWDSLEHVLDPVALVQCAKKYVFVSMPIYKDREHCVNSKHFKPGEHLHYWTQDGLIDWFARLGFVCMEISGIETQLGREGIGSFAFKRF